jgi:photosystem II PsbY protein
MWAHQTSFSSHLQAISDHHQTMAAAMATATKCMSLNPSPPKLQNQTKSKPFISLPTPPKPNVSLAVTSTALAGAVFSSLSYSEPALAIQQIAQLAAANASSDNRGLALLLPIVPAIAWVLYNILQPAINQVNKMRESKGIVVGLGIGGGLAASGLLTPPPEAYAAAEAAAASSDSRGQLLLIVVTPALLWVLYNILQPALNQINKMRSGD